MIGVFQNETFERREIDRVFSEYGTIQAIHVPRRSYQNVAYVTFERSEDAGRAIGHDSTAHWVRPAHWLLQPDLICGSQYRNVVPPVIPPSDLDRISAINDDCLINICSYLQMTDFKSLLRTSRRFVHLLAAGNRELWFDAEKYFVGKKKPDELSNTLEKAGQQMNGLSLANWDGSKTRILNELNAHCSSGNLKTLRVGLSLENAIHVPKLVPLLKPLRTLVTLGAASEIGFLLDHCPNLVEFDATNCVIGCDLVVDVLIRSSRLKSLTCCISDPEMLPTIAACLPQLEVLKVTVPYEDSEGEIVSITESEMETNLLALTEMKNLRIFALRFNFNNEFKPDLSTFLTQLASSTRLREMVLGLLKVSSQSFFDALFKMKQLKRLELRDFEVSRSLWKTNLLKMSVQLPQLETLKIQRIGNSNQYLDSWSLVHFIGNMRNLRKLKVPVKELDLDTYFQIVKVCLKQNKERRLVFLAGIAMCGSADLQYFLNSKNSFDRIVRLV